MANINDEFPVPENISADYKKAVELTHTRRIEEARDLLIRLLENEPGHPRLLNVLATTYFNTKDYDEAEQMFLNIIDKFPSFSRPYANLCIIYAAAGRFDEAAECAERVIKTRKKEPATWYTLGIYYTYINDYKTALEYFLAAYSIGPNWPGKYFAAYNIACMYALLNEPEKALEYLETSLADISVFRTAINDGDINSLRDKPEFVIIMESARGKHENDNT